MANPRVDRLEHQFISLRAMFESFINKSDERMEMMKKKLDSLLSNSNQI
jgi:hypothetical protein